MQGSVASSMDETESCLSRWLRLAASWLSSGPETGFTEGSVSSGSLTGSALLMRVFSAWMESSSIDAWDCSPCAASAEVVGVSTLQKKSTLTCQSQDRGQFSPASAFSLCMFIPKRQARLDRGAQFSKASESENFRKLSPSPARTIDRGLLALHRLLSETKLLKDGPLIECDISNSVQMSVHLSVFSPQDALRLIIQVNRWH